MKTLMCGLAMSLGILASGANADQIINVDGEDYFLSHLTANCQSITDDPAAQIACFSAISALLDEQSVESEEDAVPVIEVLDALRAVAEYQDDETGLSIAGSDCNIHIVYFNNYFHISRRNVSTIDLYSAQFDASQFQPDQTVAVQGAQAPLLRGNMVDGANAVVRGGVALDSSRQNFTPRSPRMTMDVYANEVVTELPSQETQAFDFVLVHPNKSQDSAAIQSAFEAFVSACQA